MKFSQRIHLNFPKSTRHGVGSQFSPTTEITPLQAVLESRNSTISMPLRKERDRHLSYKKEVGQTSLWNTTPISFKRRILSSWTGQVDPQSSSFSTDLEQGFCPIPLCKPNYPPTKYTEPGSVPRSIRFLPVLHFYIQHLQGSSPGNPSSPGYQLPFQTPHSALETSPFMLPQELKHISISMPNGFKNY